MNGVSSEGEVAAIWALYTLRAWGFCAGAPNRTMNRVALGLLCFVLGVLVIPAAAFVYFKSGSPPVAVTDPAFPWEKQIVHVPLNARIDREAPHGSPLQTTPENLVAGAALYKTNCAFCHGVPGHNSAYANHMYPPVPQLWKAHGHGVVGVSDDPVGETYWKVKNGIRLTGMPAYADLLSEDQMWQVSLLVAAADKPLPAAAQSALAP